MRDAPEGYAIHKLLRCNESSEVYEAVREADGLAVILKRYLADQSDDPNAHAAREFALLKRLDVRGIPRALALDRSTRLPTLVMDRLPGVSLSSLLIDGPLRIERWLDAAIQTAERLAQIHAARVIHKNLAPENVLLDAQSGKISICDFGLAAHLGDAERREAELRGTLEGTLPYIAPEQTGRMNRGCDFRSDLYSLGATLYHACTGQPPFTSTDTLELIHAHIARSPAPPVELRPDLPEALSRLVLKLLRKEPAERYQSAAALHVDLLRCREHHRGGAIPSELELGSGDAPAGPRFGARLHGRDTEIRRLLDLHATVATGCTRALWIRGEPGVGKSALVDGLRPRLALSGAYLATGSFDAERDRPYGGVVVALESLAQQFLVESDSRLRIWRGQLREGLGNIAGALVELVPDLGFILGDVPAVPALPPRETQQRLSLALQRFVQVCATPAHPLVLFIDDIQWADAGSRSLLEDLLCSGGSCALLVIGAFRSTEVSADHPLHPLLEQLAQRGAVQESLDLRPIAPPAIAALLAEALERPPEAVLQLAQLVERKTGNNPELVRQFIDDIAARGLLRHTGGEGWSWQHHEVMAADVPDGAAALMSARLDRLEVASRALIQFASCAGDEFDIELLCELSQRERPVLEELLSSLCETGLIAPCPRGFRFVHHRIREAAQAQLPEDVRAQLHYDMARLLLARTPEADRAQRVFLIVEHLNRGRRHLAAELRMTAIRLNVLAGRRALGSGAADTADGYFGVARELLCDEDWASERALAFELFLSSAESALIRRDFGGTIALLDELDRRSPAPLEAVQVAVKRIQVQALTLPPEECARFALELLAQFGVRFPLHPSRWHTSLVLRVTQWKMWRCGGAERLHPAGSLDPHRLAPILIMGVAGGVISRVDFRLAVLASCWVLCSNLRHGYLAHPGYTLSTYAGSLAHVLQASRAAQRMVQASLEWSERVPDPMYRPRTELQIQALLRPWWTRRRQALAPLEQVAESMREVGDLEYSYYARFLRTAYGALAGQIVSATEESFARIADDVQRRGHRYPQPDRCLRVYRLLRLGEASLEADLAESDAWIAASPGSAEAFIRTLWVMVLCVYGRPELAYAQSEKLGKNLFKIVPYVHVADHTFYRGITAADLAREARGAERRQHARQLQTCLRRLRRWAKGGPDFVHMVTFLEAERTCLRGRENAARLLYQHAARAAREQEYVHHAALAHERHARSLLRDRRETEAAAALRDAIAHYEAWGAAAKASALTHEHQRLTGQA
jgi:hypothetical protein